MKINQSFYPAVWVREGITVQQYRALSIKDKKKLLLRHGWMFPISEVCSACGGPIPEKKPMSGSHLLDAWFREKAETIIVPEPSMEEKS